MDQCQGFLGSFEIGPTEQALLPHTLTSMDNHTLGDSNPGTAFFQSRDSGLRNF